MEVGELLGKSIGEVMELTEAEILLWLEKLRNRGASR